VAVFLLTRVLPAIRPTSRAGPYAKPEQIEAITMRNGPWTSHTGCNSGTTYLIAGTRQHGMSWSTSHPGAILFQRLRPTAELATAAFVMAALQDRDWNSGIMRSVIVGHSPDRSRLVGLVACICGPFSGWAYADLCSSTTSSGGSPTLWAGGRPSCSLLRGPTGLLISIRWCTAI